MIAPRSPSRHAFGLHRKYQSVTLVQTWKGECRKIGIPMWVRSKPTVCKTGIARMEGCAHIPRLMGVLRADAGVGCLLVYRA